MTPSVLGSGGYSDIDVIIYRYADVYLTLAEALVMKPGASASNYTEALSYGYKDRARAILRDFRMNDVEYS
jgi:SusD family.